MSSEGIPLAVLREIVVRLAAEGWDVVLDHEQVDPLELGVKPDLVAIRDGEEMLIEIKPASAPVSVRASPVERSALASGFDYRLVVAPEPSPTSWLSRAVISRKAPGSRKLNAQLLKAQAEYERGSAESALYVAYMATARAMQSIEEALGLTEQGRSYRPRRFDDGNSLVSEGLIDPQDARATQLARMLLERVGPDTEEGRAAEAFDDEAREAFNGLLEIAEAVSALLADLESGDR